MKTMKDILMKSEDRNVETFMHKMKKNSVSLKKISKKSQISILLLCIQFSVNLAP